MKKTGMLAGILALALLAGCAGGGPGGELVAAPDDLAYQAADIQRDRELITVDGQAITAEHYLFWLVNAISSVEQYGMLSSSEGWEATLDDGMTVSEALKADALETAKLYRVVATKAKEYGVDLTQEQEEELNEQLAQIVENTGGEEAFQTQLDTMCISREGFNTINRIYYLNKNLMEKMEENGELTVTQADRDEYARMLLEEGGIYAAKHILLSTRKTNADGSYEDFSDEERAAVEERAKAMREQLRQAGDSEELFDELMNEFSEDGRDESGNLYSPNGYGLVYSGQMVPEFEAGALELEEGEIGDPVRTDYGYHIIMRIPVDQEQFQELVDAGATTSAKFQEVVEEWVEQAQVVTTTAYDQLDPKSFYVRLKTINEARAAAKATPAPTESGAPEESAAPSAGE